MKQLLSTLAWSILAGVVGVPMAWAGNCGCDRPTCQQCQQCAPQQVTVVCRSCQHHGCHGHCHRCDHCEDRSRSFQAPVQRRLEPVPRAAVVESVPMFQATPGIFAMPMMMPMQMPMMNVRSANFVQQEEPRQRSFEQPREQTCAASRDRLDELEEQMLALNTRVKTIQRAVEIQTQIWEEMKAEGKFPKRLTPEKPNASE